MVKCDKWQSCDSPATVLRLSGGCLAAVPFPSPELGGLAEAFIVVDSFHTI